MLFVDLDKTLIKSDFLEESFIKNFSQNIFSSITSIFIFLINGKASLKKYLFNKTNISIERLPYNKQVLDAIYQ